MGRVFLTDIGNQELRRPGFYQSEHSKVTALPSPKRLPAAHGRILKVRNSALCIDDFSESLLVHERKKLRRVRDESEKDIGEGYPL
jgi:hypothetical protein